MYFKNAAAIESLTWELRLADFPRSLNRSKINDLFNGFPPYSDDEVAENNIEINANFLDAPRIAHDARRQFTNAFLNPDPLFSVGLDYGPVHHKLEWAGKITREINKIIKQSLPYMEVRRSTFASLVLHGIGPCIWTNRHGWCPKAIGVEDSLVPSGTLLTMENLPFFAIYQQYTGLQLQQAIDGPKVDPGWNIPLVKSAIKWVDEQASKLMSASWPEVWSPEKWSEREKEDSGLYSSDRVPTVDAFDFYFWNDDGKRQGWERRIVLDAYGQPGVGGMEYSPTRPKRKFEFGTNEFLYDSSKRKNSKYADQLGQVIHYQFADGSSVAPFRYHSVRSLGFLLFAICHLQNRLRCRFNEHVFESLLQYFRVHSSDQAEASLKVNLINRGVIPDNVEFVSPDQRWRIEEAVVQMCFEQNRQSMQDNSSSFTQDYGAGGTKEDPRETATRVMAKVNASAALVGAMLQQAYNYQQFQYQEIARRFCQKNSKDGDVRKFRVRCLKQGVPEDALNVECWDVQPVRVIGGGNKLLAGAMAEKLMQVYDRHGPEAQQKILRLYDSVVTDDYALADDLVPESQHISDSVSWAQQSVGTIMVGAPVALQPGRNIQEVIEAWLASMGQIVQRIEQSGGVATKEELVGLINFQQHIGQAIAQLARDPMEKQKVKQYSDALGQMANMVKAYAQRYQEQQAKQQGNGQMDPEAMAKIQATVLQAKTKAQLAKESHGQRTAQRQIQFEQKLKQEQQKHAADIAATDLEAAANINLNRLKSTQD